MAQQIVCDFCNTNSPGAFLITDLATGNTLSPCLSCAPMFLKLILDSMTGGDSATQAAADGQDATEGSDLEGEPEDQEKPARWPHTDHVIPPGQRKRKRERETVAEFQATDQPEDVPAQASDA